jgi:hypothetical protein
MAARRASLVRSVAKQPSGVRECDGIAVAVQDQPKNGVPDGEDPCEWSSRQGFVLPLVAARGEGGHLRGVTIAAVGPCKVDRVSTARALVYLALGGFDGPPADRLAVWDTAGAVDLAPVTGQLARTDDLEYTLADPTLSADLFAFNGSGEPKRCTAVTAPGRNGAQAAGPEG